MAFPTYRLKALFLTTTFLATSTTAQNSTNLTFEPSGNGMNKGYNVPVNASGSTNATDSYVSVTLGDERDNNRTSSPWLYGYLSVPENSTRRTCMYMFAPIAGTTEGDESNGCSGIISQKCIDYMQRELQIPMWSFNGPEPDDTPCPNFDSDSDEYEDACGDVGFGTRLVNTNVLNTTNTTSAYSEPPEGVDWDLPDGYKTFLMYGIGVDPYGTDVDDYTDYERAGNEPVPFVVASIGEDGQSPSTQVICVAPNQAIEGSHAIPDESGASLAWRGASGMAMLMAAVVVVSLVIV